MSEAFWTFVILSTFNVAIFATTYKEWGNRERILWWN
mgnify:CR=1 FL=1